MSIETFVPAFNKLVLGGFSSTVFRFNLKPTGAREIILQFSYFDVNE